VHSQLVAAGSHGLFQRAIVESGAYQLTVPDLATAEAAGQAFAAAAGCSDQTAACLRALPVAQVLASQSNATGGASPVIDHVFLDQAIGDALATGAFNRVPVLEGSNHDEWRLFVGENELIAGPTTAATYAPSIAATLGLPLAATAPIVAHYPLASFASPDVALATLGTDAIFACNAHFAETQLARFVPTYAYEFNDEQAPERFLPPVSFPYAAAHASEIQYLFDVPVEVPAPPLTAGQQQLAHAMIAGWTQFARTGEPGAGWPRFRDEAERSLVPPAPQVETSFAADHQCAFWAALTGR
jgi:para-nitrobenzyl esterase